MSNLQQKYPDKYWHCSVRIDEIDAVVNDLSFDEINVQIITPWLQDRSFVIEGVVIHPKKVSRIRIVCTECPNHIYAQKYYEGIRSKKGKDLTYIGKTGLLALLSGKDYTFELLFSITTTEAPLESKESEENIREQIAIYQKNLQILETQAARHGMDIPLHLVNNIDYNRKCIKYLEEKLKKL